MYLVEETSSAQLYALKKIRCPFGEESVALALRECEAYTLFAPDENIIGSIDYQVVDAGDKSDPGAKTVYIVLPYYRRGNLQDAINANLVERTRFPEKRLLALFLGIARGLKRMHQFRGRRGVGGREGERGRVQGRRRDGAEGGGDGDDEAGERLMGDENIDGMREGEIRAYAHRDIKPGMYFQHSLFISHHHHHQKPPNN